MAKICELTASFPEGNWFVAQCLEIDVASQGETEALNNLQEALELHFEPPRATIIPELQDKIYPD